MRAATISSKDRMVLSEVPIPAIGGREILIRMKFCGVCGTDLEKVHGESVTPPVLGHEVVGVVEKRGEKVREFEVGENVVVHHHISCGRCTFCKNGLETLCEEFPKANLDPCGFADFFRVPQVLVDGGTVYKLPSTMTFEEGTLVEPTACCIRGLRKLGEIFGRSVAVFGVGPAGLTHVQLLRLYGAGQVFAFDLVESRRKMALSLGADCALDGGRVSQVEVTRRTNGRGVDCAVVATGNPRAVEAAIGCVRKGGKVLLFGAPARGAMLSLDLSRLFLREITFLSSYSTSEFEMRIALRLFESKRIDLAKIITHRIPLGRLGEAFSLAERGKDVGKVIVENS
jgi:L-iditol 2-dehydrogenase